MCHDNAIIFLISCYNGIVQLYTYIYVAIVNSVRIFTGRLLIGIAILPFTVMNHGRQQTLKQTNMVGINGGT